jgi:hypothetical protein
MIATTIVVLLALVLYFWSRRCVRRAQRERLALRALANLSPRPWVINHHLDQVHESAHWFQLLTFRNPIRLYHVDVAHLINSTGTHA